MSLPDPIPPVTGEPARQLAEKLGVASPTVELPVSVVKRIARDACGDDARFSPEVIEQLALHAQKAIRELAVASYNAARIRGRKTTQSEDIVAALASLAEQKPGGKRPPGSRAEQALARANRKLEKHGLVPELLGAFTPSEGDR